MLQPSCWMLLPASAGIRSQSNPRLSLDPCDMSVLSVPYVESSSSSDGFTVWSRCAD